jgi:hypothetical protein
MNWLDIQRHIEPVRSSYHALARGLLLLHSPGQAVSLIAWSGRRPTLGATRRYSAQSAQSAEWRRAPGAAASLSDAAAVSIVLRSCRRNFPSAIPAFELAAELSELSERARALAPASLPRFSS